MIDKLLDEISLGGDMAELSTKIAYATTAASALASLYDEHIENTREREVFEYEGVCEECGIEGGCFCVITEIR